MRSSQSLRMFRPTQRMMRPVPNEEQSGHTITQRLRRLKQVPPELIPIGVVVGIALGFAVYSLGKKFTDKQMRLSRQNRKD